MRFFDCDACFGPAMVPGFRQAEAPEELLEEMDFCGIEDALVFHAAMRDDSPVFGNQLAVEGAAKSPRLHPTWAILPPQTEELGTIDEFFEQMRMNNVRALTAFPSPSQHQYLLNSTTFGPFFARMVECKVPLIVAGDWALIDQILHDFPDMTLIAIHQSNHSQDRYFRPLLEKYPNFYTGTTRYQCDGGMAALCRKYGAGRILFGSGFPDLPMGAAMLSLLHADISESDRTAIASDNLHRLLEEVRL